MCEIPCKFGLIWGFKKQGVTLDALGAALECGQKSGQGFDVSQWWAARELEAIKAYCLEDVRISVLLCLALLVCLDGFLL